MLMANATIRMLGRRIPRAPVAHSAWRPRGFSDAPERPERQARHLQLPGPELHVVTQGDLESGATPVLCLPGRLGTAMADFGPQLDALSLRHGVVSFDPRGLGLSAPRHRRRYASDYHRRDAEDAAAVMEALGCERYHVLGWSDGAVSGTMLAAANPEVVEKLVIFGAQSNISQSDRELYESLRNVEDAWSPQMLEMYGDESQPMWSSFVDTMIMLEAVGGDLCKKDAIALECPTLILHGKKDSVVSVSHAEWFHDNIPGSELYVFSAGRHNIHIQFTKTFNKKVLAFFADE